MIRAVFLDREGVITPKLERGEYLLRPEQVTIAPGVSEALRRLRDQGIPLFIVTNQSCVGRGLLSREACNALHAEIVGKLAAAGVRITDSRICPHTDEDACVCRKPKPGMIFDLFAAYGISPKLSVMIGDSMTDVEAGEAAGCTANFFLTEQESLPLPSRTHAVRDLFSAVEQLLTNDLHAFLSNT